MTEPVRRQLEDELARLRRRFISSTDLQRTSVRSGDPTTTGNEPAPSSAPPCPGAGPRRLQHICTLWLRQS
jgi:hypothetical protein